MFWFRRSSERSLRLHPSCGLCSSATIAILVPLLACRASLGTALVDQSVIIPPSTSQEFHDVNEAADWAQTFTVGWAGTLAGVGLELWADQPVSSPLIVDVRPTVNGMPAESDAALASAVLQPSAFPNFPRSAPFAPPFTFVDLSSAGLSVTKGEVLALVLRSAEPYDTPGHEYLWVSTHQFVSVYPGGSSFVRVAGHSWSPSPAGSALDQDQGFQTFINVPEPSPGPVLCIVGLSALALRRRTAG